MGSNRLRPIILKLQDRLTNEDRKRLHFYLGNDVPRPIRDDSTLSGTLNLMDSLFDQDKINEQDFTLLINAFDEIRCFDARNLLREHLRQNQSNGLNQSIESLSLIMPPMIDQLYEDQVEDEDGDKRLLLNQMSTIVDDQKSLHSESKIQQISNSSSVSFWKCLLLFSLLSFVVYGVIIVFSVRNNIGIEQLKIKNNQSIALLQHVKHLLVQLQYKRPVNPRWKQNAITIAGGNERGNELNQLNSPRGIYVDDDNQSIYIADHENFRIVEWKFGAKNGQVVADGNGKGNRMDQLNRPTNVVVDQKNDSLIICDRKNRRVVRWSRQNGTNGQTIIFDIDYWGLTMDNNGNLYVSDTEKSEVRRWKIGDINGTIVAGGNKKGDHLNQLNFPTYIFVDQDHSVYVTDHYNHRVMNWMKGAKEGIVVAGGQGQGSNLTQLLFPQGVIVDHLGLVFVADSWNHRIMRWSKGSKEGSIIVGRDGQEHQPNQFNYLGGLSFDR